MIAKLLSYFNPLARANIGFIKWNVFDKKKRIYQITNFIFV